MVSAKNRHLGQLFLVALGLTWIVAAVIAVRGTGDDWKIFWTAGHYVGSLRLLTVSHFAYMPGAAWALSPFAHVPRELAYFVYAAIMIALSLGAAVLASRVYGIPKGLTTFMALAWWPLTISICLGQNAPVALFLVMTSIVGLVRKQEALVGVAVGLAFYKPTVALPLLALLVALRLWKAVGIVAAICGIWYVASAGAVGAWFWPKAYLHALADLYQFDRVVDGDYAISVPGVFIHMGLSPIAGWALGGALLLAALPLLVRAPRLEAASMLPVVGLATTPHAYGYDALLLLPALWYLAAKPTTLRVVFVVLAYAVAPLYLLSRTLHFDMLALPVIAIAVGWAAWRIRLEMRRRNDVPIAASVG